MLALTLYQPWAYCVVHRGKDIENRDWKPSARVIAERPWIAIHAGRTYDNQGAEWLRAREVSWEASDILYGHILGIGKLVDVITHSNSKWFMGRYGWVLSPIIALPRPIKVSGQMGLWYTSQQIEDDIKEQLRLSHPLLLEKPQQGSLFDLPKLSGGIRQIEKEAPKETTKSWKEEEIDRDSPGEFAYKSKGVAKGEMMHKSKWRGKK